MDSRMNSGIYVITNIENSKVYIGSTSNLKKRWAYHSGNLRRGAHRNFHLQRAWDKYGGDTFKFGVLECLDDLEELYLAEQFWCDIYCEEDTELYNMATVGPAPMLGVHFSEEHRRKLSEALSGKNNPKYGRPVSAETRARISSALKGHKHTEEARDRMSKAQRGNQNPARVYPAFIHKELGRVIPPGVNLGATCRKHILHRGHMWEVVHGKRTSHKGWELHDEKEVS